MKKLPKLFNFFLYFCMMIILYHARGFFVNSIFQIGAVFDFASLLILFICLSMYFLERKFKEDFKKLKWFISITVLIVCLFNVLMPSINILSYMFVFLFILFITFWASKFFGKETPISLGISVSILLCILWLLGVLNLLRFTKFFIIILLIVGVLYLYFYYKKSNKKVIEEINNFLDWHVIILGLLFIVSIVNGFERYVHIWDEYNMWGIQAKKVILTHSINGCDHPIIMALWSYFVSIFDTFKEPNLYIAHSLFIYIFLMSIFSLVKDKKIYPILFLVMFTFCYLFKEVYNFSTLYADLPSAVVFGFGLVCFFGSAFKNKVEFYPLLLAAFLLTLLKLQGFVLATTLLLICISYIVINQMKWTKKTFKNNIKEVIKRYFPLLLIPLVLFIVWYFYSKNILLNGAYESKEVIPPSLSTTLISDFNFYNISRFINNFFEFLDKPAFYSIVQLSFFQYIILLISLLFIYFYRQNSKVVDALKKIVPFMLGIVCFYSLTLLASASQQATPDALNLASLGRYLGNFNVGIFMFVVWLYFSMLYRSNKIKYIILLVCTGIIVISVPLNSTLSFVLDLDDRYEQRNIYYQNKERFDAVIKHTKKGSRIYVVDQEDKLGYLSMCHSLYYLYPRVVNTNGSINWKIATDSNREDLKGWGMTVQKLKETFIDYSFDYLYLYSSTDELFTELSQLLLEKDQQTVHNYILFKIKRIGNRVILQPVM